MTGHQTNELCRALKAGFPLVTKSWKILIFGDWKIRPWKVLKLGHFSWKRADIWSQKCWKINHASTVRQLRVCWSSSTVTFVFVVIDSKAIACSFTVSCFGMKFIGRCPKRCKSRCWLFAISGPKNSWKSSKFHSEILVGTLWSKLEAHIPCACKIIW